MDKIILVAGATGDLGGRIVKALVKNGATVRALVRHGADAKKIEELKSLGATIVPADLTNVAEIAKACTGVTCVVSALAGLRDVIVDTQLNVLHGAIEAGVPRFIPSDFSTDFTQVNMGDNRNFDLRKEFRTELDKSNIKATSVFNGAFADILRYNTPLFDTKSKTITYYDGKLDWEIDFTTMDDTAAYTALVALDDDTPRNLNIASFTVTPNSLVGLSEKYKGHKFELVNKGPLAGFAAGIKGWRASNPEGEKNLYPQWQQAQYLYCMFATQHNTLDNNRYANLKWAGIEGWL